MSEEGIPSKRHLCPWMCVCVWVACMRNSPRIHHIIRVRQRERPLRSIKCPTIWWLTNEWAGGWVANSTMPWPWEKKGGRNAIWRERQDHALMSDHTRKRMSWTFQLSREILPILATRPPENASSPHALLLINNTYLVFSSSSGRWGQYEGQSINIGKLTLSLWVVKDASGLTTFPKFEWIGSNPIPKISNNCSRLLTNKLQTIR